jgi:peptide/nickel transport system permease protein
MTSLATARRIMRKYRSNPSLVIGSVLVSIVVVVALFAPVLAPRDPLSTTPISFAVPQVTAPFGTDNLGRDLLSGVLFGMRLSLFVGVTAAVIAVLIGVVVGGIAGYRGGTTDLVLMRLTEMFQIIPQFFLALVLVALLGRGIEKVIFVLGVLGWPLIARVVRAQFLALKQREFTEAARALGAGSMRIALLVLLPTSLAPIMVTATQGVGQAILLEAGVSFFGLGDPNHMSLGFMVHAAQSFLYSAWWMSVFPGLGIFLAVLGFTLLGDGLNDVFNPRWRR